LNIPWLLAVSFARVFDTMFAVTVLFTVVLCVFIILPKWVYNHLLPSSHPMDDVNVLTRFIFAIGLLFATIINAIYYILVFIPIITYNYIHNSFTLIATRLEGRNTLVKIPFFLGLAFAMLISGFFYLLFLYPIIGLEKVWELSFGEPTSNSPIRPKDKQANKPRFIRIDNLTPKQIPKHHRRTPTDEISELDLGNIGGEDIAHTQEKKTMEEVAMEIRDWDDRG
jgi:hypothetical protein